MNKKILIVFVLCACLATSFVTYQFLFTSQPSQEPPHNNDDSHPENPVDDPTTTNSPSINNDDDQTAPTATPNNRRATGDTTPVEVPINTDEPVVPHVNVEDHEEASDYVWSSSEVINIALSGNSITVGASGVATVEGSKVTITSAGTYRLSGSLTDGQVNVNADKAVVRLLLNNVNIHCSNSAPLFVMDSKKTIIVLQEGTQNTITDGSSYTVNADGEPNAAVFGKSDLTVYGEGSLNVQANYNDGISSMDGLILDGGQITVDAVGDAIRGKDYIVVKDGNFNLEAGCDGLKSDDKDVDKGYITIENGNLHINAGEDAVNAQTDFLMKNGQITAFAGGGSSNNVVEGFSTKGIKAIVDLVIDAGTFNIDSSDDAIHSNGTLTINGGTFNLATNDDAMHSDDTLVVNNGDITVTKSYEGLESAAVTINNGNIHIVSRDDGINVAGGNDGSGFIGGGGGWGGGDTYGSGDYHLYINGGYIYINSGTDGLDSNGDIIMTGGKVIVDGPTTDMESAIDHDFPPPQGKGGFKMTGGYILAVGSAGMAVGPNASSTQYSVMYAFSTNRAAGTMLHLRTNSGTEIFTFKPVKQYRCFVFCSPDLTLGTTYEVYTGGSSTGTVADGLYIGGTYTPGTRANLTFKISSITSKVGSFPSFPFF